MKKVYLLVLTTILFSCGKDETEIPAPEPTIEVQGFLYNIKDVTTNSFTLRVTENGVRSSGGRLTTEIWFKEKNAEDWSKQEIDLVLGVGPTEHIVEGLKPATKYFVKPVFSISEIVKEAAQQTTTTKPFEFFRRKNGLEGVLLVSQDENIDFRELETKPSFFVKYKNDSIPMIYEAVSQDSLIASIKKSTLSFFEPEEPYIEKIEATVGFKVNDYYDDNFQLDLYNKRPKIDSLYFQRIEECDGLTYTKLLFQGLFWNASILLEDTDANRPDDYRISIKNIQDPSISSPILTIDGLSTEIPQSCETGFNTLFDLPIQNRFHQGSFLWTSVPKDILPEGEYKLEFSVIKNEEIYTADSFEFILDYDD